MLQSSGFLSYHKQNIPKCSLDSEKKSIQHSRKLYKLLLQENQCLIMDDKTYIKKDFAQVPGQPFYYKFKGKDVKNKFKNIQTEKFALKYLIWQGLCSCGLHCPPLITEDFGSGYLHQGVSEKEIANFHQESHYFYTFLA